MGMLQGYCRATTIHQILSTLFAGNVERLSTKKARIFNNVLGYDGIKRTFSRSLISKEPVHILIVGPPGHAKTLFLKCILETFGKSAFFTVGGNASKSGLIDVLFEMQPKYLLVDEIEHLKSDYQTTLLSLMETGILTQTMHNGGIIGETTDPVWKAFQDNSTNWGIETQNANTNGHF